MVCCEIVSLVIDVYMFQVIGYNVADFQVVRISRDVNIAILRLYKHEGSLY